MTERSLFPPHQCPFTWQRRHASAAHRFRSKHFPHRCHPEPRFPQRRIYASGAGLICDGFSTHPSVFPQAPFGTKARAATSLCPERFSIRQNL